jgi:hypothetical protein
MRAIADNVGDVLALVMAAALILYAPFAKTLARAVLIVFIASLIGSVYRSIVIIEFREFEPPMFASLFAFFHCR